MSDRINKIAGFGDDGADSLIDELLGGSSSATVPSSPAAQKPGGQLAQPGVYRSPVNGKIISRFQLGGYISERHQNGHPGLDIMAQEGTPIYPIAPGTVIEAGTNPKGGISCKISHEDGVVVSYYAHMSSMNVRTGQVVDFNDKIGGVGKSGSARSTSAHLHYTVKINGSYIDPLSIIGKPIGSLSKRAELFKLIEKMANRFELLVNLLHKS